MPHVAGGEGLDRPFLDVADFAAERGEGEWRAALVGTPGLRVVLLRWGSGFATHPHVHPHAEEIFYILDGRARFTIGDEPERDVGPGAFLYAARGVRHAIRVPEGSTVTILAAVGPNEDVPDETVEVD